MYVNFTGEKSSRIFSIKITCRQWKVRKFCESDWHGLNFLKFSDATWVIEKQVFVILVDIT